jgi:glycosyltransferase involved in cell wall biosynthesis
MTTMQLDRGAAAAETSGAPGDVPVDFLPGPGIAGMVSVVIPSYNRAGIVGASIESVLRQSWTNVEVIVVDDGSKDDTRAVVEAYGAPVRYVHQANAGVSAARNTGFAHARGEFVALLDSDDLYLPWKLEAQVRVLRANPEVGMVWTDMSAVSEHGALLQERYLRTFYDAHAVAKLEQVFERAGTLRDTWPEAPAAAADAPVWKGEIFSQMLLGNLVHTSTVVLRRERLRRVGLFDTSLERSGEDYEFHLRTCSHGAVALIDAPSLLYRVGASDQLTAPDLAMFRARNNLTTVRRWVARGAERIRLPRSRVRWRLAHAYGWVGELELFYGDRAEARTHLWRGVRYRPMDRKLLMLLTFAVLPPVALRGALRLKRAIWGRRPAA